MRTLPRIMYGGLGLLVAAASMAACGGTDEDSGAEMDAGADGGASDAARTDGERPDAGPGETGTPLVPGFVDGTRLAAITLTVAGTPPAFGGWWDTELGVECVFLTAEDGQLRCLPRDPHPIPLRPYFTDASCTEPFYASSGMSCAPQPFLRLQLDRAAGECVTRHGMWHVEEITPPAEAWSFGASCEGPEPFDATGGISTYAVADAWPASSFVAATRTEEPIDAGMSARVLVAEDGARRVEGLTDATFGRCEPMFDSDGQRRCFPPVEAAFGLGAAYFADASCTAEPLGGSSVVSGCPEPRYIHELVRTDGENRFRLFQTGDRVTTTVYRLAGTDCTPQEVMANQNLFRLGEEVTSDLAVMGETTVGTGPATLLAYTHGDEPVLPFHLADARSFVLPDGTDCQPYAFADEGWRCVPSPAEALVEPEYADAACTMPLLARSSLPSAPPPPAVVFERGEERCDRRITSLTLASMFSVGAAHTGTVYASDGAGCCDALPPDDIFAYHRLATLDPGTLVEATCCGMRE